MIFLHALLFTGVLLQVSAAPDFSKALSKVSEAKARAAANRAKLKASSERIASRFRAAAANRPKRQYELQYPQAYSPPPSQYVASPTYAGTPTYAAPPPYVEPPASYEEDDEPLLVEIYSAEDEDDYARSAKDDEDDEKTDSTGEMGEPDSRNSDNLDPKLEASNPHFHKIHHHSHHVHHSHGHVLPPTHNPIFPQTVPHATASNVNVNINHNQNLNHGGQTSHFPLHGGFPSGSHISPHQTAVISDHRQIFDPRGHQHILPQQHLNLGHNTLLGNTQRHEEKPVGAEQTDESNNERCDDSDFELREADPTVKTGEDSPEVPEKNEGETVGSPTFKKKKNKGQYVIVPVYNQRPPYYGNSYGRYREAENLEEISDNDGTTTPDSNDQLEINPSNETVGSPTFKKKDKEPLVIVLPIYNQNSPSYSQAYGQYREAENGEDQPENIVASTAEVQQNDEDSGIRATGEIVGSPTFKKKDKNPQVIVVPIYSQNAPYYSQGYGQYREAESPEENLKASTPEMQEDIIEETDKIVGSPTFKKKDKNGQVIVIPIYNQNPYYSQSYGNYREAENSEDNAKNLMAPAPETLEESPLDTIGDIVGSPTCKKKKGQPRVIVVPVYNQNQPYYSSAYGQYREAENLQENLEEPTEIREIDPSKQEGHFGEDEEENKKTEQRMNDDLDAQVSSNFLFNFPHTRRFSDQYKRSLDKELDAILGEERQIVDALGDHPEKDEDLKFIAELSNRTLTDLEEKRKNITKRSLPLTRLISDPHVKLDVPQTMENFGTAAKYTLEDEKAPIHHFKNMLGSSRNALLSAMRIPPQNLIIPSDYEIVKSSELVGASRNNADDDVDDRDPFGKTFKKVGHIVRESVKSGQETVAHLGDAAHSARHILNSARHSAPRLIIPYSQIPAIQDTRMKKPNKALLITPRLLDLTDDTTSSKANEIKPNLIRLGHLMDSIGLSKPDSRNLDLQKIIFEPRKLTPAKADERLLQLYSKFRDNYDNADTVSEALSTLEDAKISVGAKTLSDFLAKMKGELSDFVQNKPPKKRTKLEKKKQETKEMGKFIENLFDGKKLSKNAPPPKNENQKEIVGEGLNLPPELLHPFMGRASDTDLKQFFKDHGDEDELKRLQNFLNHNQKLPGGQSVESNSNLGHVVGAINPLMFERIYNETVGVKNKEATTPEDTFQIDNQRNQEEESDGTVGTSFTMTEPLLTPFMGQAQPDQVADLLETYNGDEAKDLMEIKDE